VTAAWCGGGPGLEYHHANHTSWEEADIEGATVPVISQEEAVERLTREVVEKLPPEEVVDVYNEIFRKDRRTETEVTGDVTPLVQRLVAYINGGQSIDRIIDLWRLIFTLRYHNVGWDEDTEGIHYDEGPPRGSEE
jgi:hypothetical protein